MTSTRSISSYSGSMQSSEGQEVKKYILVRDTVAKSRWPHGVSAKSRILSKRSEQRVLKGSLWQEMEEGSLNNSMPASTSRSLSRSGSSMTTSPGAPTFKQCVESIEIEDLTLQCAAGFLHEITDEICRMLLAIPTSEERYYVFSDTDRMKHAQFINVGSDVIVNKRNIPPCRAAVRWKGRLAGKQGLWFGVEIVDEQSKGSGDSDGSVNNIRLFNCDKNNGMFVNVGQLTLVPPKRPMRRQKKKAPSTPSQGSENMTNGSQNSDLLSANDLVSQTESELSFMDDVTSAETVPLVDLQVNDRVVWPSDEGYERAIVRWIGTLPEEEALQGEILVGVEFDNPIGKGTGVYKNRRLFEAKKGHASLVPLEGLVKVSSSGRNQSDTSSPQSLNTPSSYDQVSPQQLALPPISADDVLESLAINSSEPEQLSDVNNNGSRTSQQLKESPTPRHNHLRTSQQLSPDHPRTSQLSPDSPPPSKTPPPALNDIYHHKSPPPPEPAKPPEFTSKPPPLDSYKPSMNGDILHDSYDSLASATSNSTPPTTYANTSQHQREKPTTLPLSRGMLPSVGSVDTTDADDWMSCDSPVPVQKTKTSPTRHRPKNHSMKTRYSKPGSHIKHGSSLDRHPPRSKTAKQRSNGLIGLHTLAAQDMTDIIGDLESPRNGSLSSATENESASDSALQHSTDDPLPEKSPTVNHNSKPLTYYHDNPQTREDNHNHDQSMTLQHLYNHKGKDNHITSPDEIDRKYLVARLSRDNSQNSLLHSESDHSSTSSETISEEGSYTIQRDDTLSPLMEASICSSHKGGSSTPPLCRDSATPPNYRQDSSPLRDSLSPSNHKDSTHPAIKEQTTPDLSSLPQPMREVALEPGMHSLDMNEVPDPPPEFMSNFEHNLQPYQGMWKGMPGTKGLPSYMEAILYLLSISTDLLCCDKMESSYTELRNFLLQRIVHPLKRGEYVDVGVMDQWRSSINEISTGQLLQTDSARELHKFLKLLLQHICNLPPLYDLNNHETGYTINLISYKDARIGFPTVQKLLEKTCVQQQIKLNKVPHILILVLPRWTLNNARIFPNLHIDLTDVLEYARRICHMCGDQAVFECPECYENETTELSAAAFCEPCSQTVHKHSKRLNHMPVQMKTVSDLSQYGEEGSILRLRGLLTVRGDHYTSLSEPAGAEASNSQWLAFDPQAAEKDSGASEGTCYIPEVAGVAGVSNWLSIDAYEDMARDLESIPNNIEQVLQECCMCVYSKI